MKSLYYEIHVTIAPDFDRIEEVRDIASEFGFHMGDLLLMKKDDERSHKDMFFTARNTDSYLAALAQTQALVLSLKAEGFSVWRYKIEDTLLDSRIDDALVLL